MIPRSLVLAAVAALGAALPAQEPAPPALAHEKEARAVFGQRVEVVDGRLLLRVAAQRLPILWAGKDGDVGLEASGRFVVVLPSLAASGWLDAAVDALPRLVARLGPAPPPKRRPGQPLRIGELELELQEAPPSFTLAADPLLGPHVWSSETLVTGERLLRSFPAPGRPELRLQDEVRALLPSIDRSSLHPLGQRALRRLLAIVAEGKHGDEEPPPHLLLRLIGGGWLRGHLEAGPPLDRLEQVARQASDVAVTALWRDEHSEYSRRQGPYSAPASVLRDRDATRYRVSLPSWNDLPPLDLVVELPPRSDPVRDADRARAASLWLGPRRVAHWRDGAELAVEPRLWERLRQGTRELGVVDRDYLPPHLPIVAPDGALVLLVTKHGVLRPPRRDDPARFDHFVAEAARVLPDAAHLDLLREHMFHYVHDSPDNRWPELVGVPGAVGEIHQTWQETLATTAGGRFRGDCDDLAELFHEVVRVQGKLGHLIVVPGHNALAFAERRGTVWTVHVLHTGEPLTFRSRDLQQALAGCFWHFQHELAFDASQVPIAVRFSGERQRSQWLLSWRIFADARYAETLIDVQRDWHLNTLGRGLRKMEALVAAGDDDAANHLEMAGLSERMGNWPRAADAMAKAMERVEDPVLANALRQVDDLYRAGRVEAARAAVDGILASGLPELRRRSSVTEYLAKTVELVDVLVARRDLATALRVLEADARHRFGRLIDAEASAPKPELPRPTSDPTRDAMRSYVDTVLELLLEHRAALPAEVATALFGDVRRWVESIALHDVERPIDAVWRDATVGLYWLAVHGPALDARLAQSGGPGRGAERRPYGTADADLPWVKVSIPFWFSRLGRLFGEDRPAIDRAEVARLAAALKAAHAGLAEIDVHDDGLDFLLFQGRLLAALASGDRRELTELLAQARTENDKDLRDAAAEWIGEAARFLEPPVFTMVLDVWDQELGYRPLYLAMAWAALRTGAAAQALLAAERAAARFPDEPAFRDELAELRSQAPHSSKLRAGRPAPGRRSTPRAPAR